MTPAPIGGGGVLAWTVPTLVAAAPISVFVFVYKTSVPVQQQWMRELMAPEVELGVVTAAELDTLAGSPATLGRYLHTQPIRRRAACVLSAERELAHQIARDGGTETAAVQQARAAIGRARTA